MARTVKRHNQVLQQGERDSNLQLVSADDSRFALIFSFKLSASLRAAAIRS